MASILVGVVALVVLSVVTSVSSFPTGAPSSACTVMVPGHAGIASQTTAAPFTITASPLTYTNPGDNVTVTITATGAPLVGFLLQARRADPNLDTATPVGTFTAILNTQLMSCTAAGDSLTHTDAYSNSFTTMSVVWTASATGTGHIKFTATLAQAKETYWLYVTSPIVNDTVSGAIVTTPTYEIDTDSDNSVIDISMCGNTKSCIRTPAGCNATTCESIITWAEDTDPNYINFEMARMSSGWIGLGFSSDRAMGDDSIIACLRASDGSQTVSQSLNVGRTNTAIANPKYEGIDDLKVGYNNNRQMCRFRRKKLVTGRTTEIYDLTSSYYIIIAKGDTFKSVDSSIRMIKHSATPIVSSAKQEFTQIEDLATTTTIHPNIKAHATTTTIHPNIKAHGCMMIVAWTMLSAFDITKARHFKKQWPGSKIGVTGAWFPLHALSMVSALLLTIIAFVHINGYSNITTTPTILEANPVLGVIVTLLALLNGQLFHNVVLGIVLAGLLSFGIACAIIIAIS